MKIHGIRDGLSLIALDQPIPGFHGFIGAWVAAGGESGAVLVDPGPTATVPLLAEALEHLGVTRLDAVLLTHIHIDHAGGTGHLVRRFPDTPVVCHATGLRHMADPAKLWAGSVKTLGDTARAYGEMLPVPEELLVDAQAHTVPGIRAVATPGHASHHVSFLREDVLFAGEAAGVHLHLPGGGSWLRPATPPRYFPEVHLASLNALAGLPHNLVCHGHFGATDAGEQVIPRHRKQLVLWDRVVGRVLDGAGEGAGEDEWLEPALDALLDEDPEMAAWPRLPGDVRQRERGFLHNSVRGFAQAQKTPR